MRRFWIEHDKLEMKVEKMKSCISLRYSKAFRGFPAWHQVINRWKTPNNLQPPPRPLEPGFAKHYQFTKPDHIVNVCLLASQTKFQLHIHFPVNPPTPSPSIPPHQHGRKWFLWKKIEDTSWKLGCLCRAQNQERGRGKDSLCIYQSWELFEYLLQ